MLQAERASLDLSDSDGYFAERSEFIRIGSDEDHRLRISNQLHPCVVAEPDAIHVELICFIDELKRAYIGTVSPEVNIQRGVHLREEALDIRLAGLVWNAPLTSTDAFGAQQVFFGDFLLSEEIADIAEETDRWSRSRVGNKRHFIEGNRD